MGWRWRGWSRHSSTHLPTFISHQLQVGQLNSHTTHFLSHITCMLIQEGTKWRLQRFICPLRKHRAGVDIHSCSQFLLELYSQWLIPGSPNNRRTPTILISEVVRSVSYVTRALIISLLYIYIDTVHCSLETLLYLSRSPPPALFVVAAGGVGPVHREEPVWYDVLHPNGATEAPPAGRWDPQSIPGACHLQGCCCTGHGEQGCVGRSMFLTDWSLECQIRGELKRV